MLGPFWGQETYVHTETSSAITICILDIKNNESLASKEWIHRPFIPILARSYILPQKIGAHKSDCNHGEAMAIRLQEECLPIEISRCVIMDSKSVRSRIMELLNNSNLVQDRQKIRCVFPGIDKGIMSRINFNMQQWKDAEHTSNLIPDSPPPPKYKAFCIDVAAEIHVEFVNLINEEYNTNGEWRQVWKRPYLDDHKFWEITIYYFMTRC